MKIRIKKLDEKATVPEYAKEGDAGMDLVATSKTQTQEYVEYGTGLAFEIPEGYVGFLFPRSSVSKTNLLLCNSVGVLDSGYRGEVKFRFKKVRNQTTTRPTENWNLADEQPNVMYKVGDKIGQIMVIPHPTMEIEVSDELSETARGEGGFGSSGS